MMLFHWLPKGFLYQFHFIKSTNHFWQNQIADSENYLTWDKITADKKRNYYQNFFLALFAQDYSVCGRWNLHQHWLSSLFKVSTLEVTSRFIAFPHGAWDWKECNLRHDQYYLLLKIMFPVFPFPAQVVLSNETQYWSKRQMGIVHLIIYL